MSEQWDVDLAVATIYGDAGYFPEDPPGPIAMALRLFGIDGVRRVADRSLPGDARLTQRQQEALALLDRAPFDERWIVEVRRRLTDKRLVWAVAHELAEWVLKERLHCSREDVEDYANAVGAALIAPREAFSEAVSICGRDFKELAEVFCADETWAALRYGEVFDLPLVVVKEVGEEVRGGEFIWPQKRKLRRLARHPEECDLAVEHVTLTDNDRRVVLIACCF